MLNLLVDIPDECLQVAVHLREHLKTSARVSRLISLGVFALFGDKRVAALLSLLADPLDILLALRVDGLFVLVAFPRHFGEVDLTRLLVERAAHSGFDAASHSLLANVVSPEACV